MNAFTANVLGTAGLLARPRHDDDGAPPAMTPPPASQARAVTRYAWLAPGSRVEWSELAAGGER